MPKLAQASQDGAAGSRVLGDRGCHLLSKHELWGQLTVSSGTQPLR